MSAAGTVFLMGPTACGKTELAAALVRRFPMEIVSVDSALVYRGMDIGTAKPDAALLRRAPHRMIDTRDPREPYSASDFARDAADEIQSIKDAGRVPLLVGGTGLYFHAIEGRLAELPPADLAVRAEIESEAEARGWSALHAELASVDPEAAARISPNDRQRVQRALEVYRVTGRSISNLHRTGLRAPRSPLLKLALAPRDRQQLWSRIEQRFERMLAADFEGEVRGLVSDPRMRPGLPALRAVGYRQMAGYLEGRYDRQTMIDKALAATRQLSKRQMTWLRNESGLRWLWLEEGDVIARAARLIRENALIQTADRDPED